MYKISYNVYRKIWKLISFILQGLISWILNVDFQYNKFIIHNIHHVILIKIKLFDIFFLLFFIQKYLSLYTTTILFSYYFQSNRNYNCDNSRHLNWNRKEFNNSIDIASSVKIVHPTTIRYLARLHYFLVQNPHVEVH